MAAPFDNNTNQPRSQGPLSTLRFRDEPKDRYHSTSAVFTKTAGHCNLPQVLPFQTDSLSCRGLGTRYNARKWTSGTQYEWYPYLGIILQPG